MDQEGGNGAEWVATPRSRPTRDSKVEKWTRWLEDNIRSEVLTIYWQRHVYRTVGEIVNQREPRLPGSHFFDHLRDTYAITQAVAIRRQAERSQRVISLGTLLAEIEDDPERLTRERFVGMYDQLDRQLGEQVFTERFAGAVGSHVDPAIVADDAAQLEAQAARIVEYVNKHVAHVDRAPLTNLPGFQDLNGAIDNLGDTFRKYVLLLTASSYATLVPVPQSNWEAIFDEPWRTGPGLTV